MPIYMDRHEMEETTAKAVADAHQKDLGLQGKYAIEPHPTSSKQTSVLTLGSVKGINQGR